MKGEENEKKLNFGIDKCSKIVYYINHQFDLGELVLVSH